MEKIKIISLKDLKERKVVRFAFSNRGKPAEGFLVSIDGKLVAYENRCRHLPVKLDAGEGKFFSPDGEHFICQQHNALYEPSSGVCVRGPCEGESLRKLEVTLEDGIVWVNSD